MHWIDEVLELEAFHSRMIEEIGAYENRGQSKTTKGWSIRDTARRKAISPGKASEDLRLAKFFRLNTVLCRKLDRKEALFSLRCYGLVKIGGK